MRRGQVHCSCGEFTACLVAYLVVCVKSVCTATSAGSSNSIYVHNPRRTLYPQRSLASLAFAHAHAHARPLFFGILLVLVVRVPRTASCDAGTTCADSRSNSVRYLTEY